MRIVFFGSGEFAVPTLERLHSQSETFPLVQVVTRPDRPAGRGKKLRPTPVRLRAGELGLGCIAPATTRDESVLALIASLKPDLFIVADYGEILGQALIDLAPIGIFNLHGSVLPAYRGAAPVAHALLERELETGVTLFRIERGLDSGPVVATRRLAVEPLETSGELEARLAEIAAELLGEHLPRFASGEFTEVDQAHDLATFAPKLEKADAEIDWTANARCRRRAHPRVQSISRCV